MVCVAKSSLEKLKFEDAMARLDAIVEAMEAGEIGIEESIARYEEAMSLAAHCRQILTNAELRIKKIQADASGEIRAEPLVLGQNETGDDAS